MWQYRRLEARVRKLAKERCLAIYTGVSLDTLRLEDKPIKLGELDRNNNFVLGANLENRINVPKYFWKLIVDKRKGQAIAVVGINNVHERVDPSRDVPCRSCKLEDISWFTQGNNNKGVFTEFTKGYMFCCTLSEFRTFLTYDPAPELSANFPLLKHERDSNTDLIG